MTTLHCFEVAEHPYSKGNLNRRPVTGLISRSPWQHGRAQAATASGQAPNELEGYCKMRASAARAAGRKPPRSTQKNTYPIKHKSAECALPLRPLQFADQCSGLSFNTTKHFANPQACLLISSSACSGLSSPPMIGHPMPQALFICVSRRCNLKFHVGVDKRLEVHHFPDHCELARVIQTHRPDAR